MNSEDKTLDAAAPNSAQPENTRRAYQKPALRRLGSVRDLTLGSTGSFNDARNLKQTSAPTKM
jgi:hypothetical protein